MNKLVVTAILYCVIVVYLLFNMENDRSMEVRKVDCVKIRPISTTPLDNPADLVNEVINVRELDQYGPGANGDAVTYEKDLLQEEDLAKMEEGWNKHDYNAFISDTISHQRIIRDYRPAMCRQLTYPPDMPKVSVVIPFRDERLSVLLRTVYSILHNSPPELLEEIILVDDGSTLNDLKYKLEIHIRSLPKVHLIRKQENVGLMMARQAGIDATVTEYFISMDSHMECLPGWLEPIMFRLLQQPRGLLCSTLGGIDNDNFKVTHRLAAGEVFDFPFFSWNMEQQLARYSQKYKDSIQNATDPLLMGSVMGMMICMKKSWFLQLGGFDPGMKVWGSEQIEMSMKVWMCGGVIEQIPCSYVVHIYRRIVWDVRTSALLNKYRMLAVWVDEPYKQVVLDYNVKELTDVDIGNISARIRIRKINKCKPFQYFLDKVQEFADIHVPVNHRKYGTPVNLHTGMCLDQLWPNGPGLYHCHRQAGIGTQLFEYTQKKELRHEGHCVIPKPDNNVTFQHCDHFEHPQTKMWEYSDTEQTLRHVDSEKCLTADGSRLIVNHCSISPSQKWTWKQRKRREGNNSR